MIADVEDPGSPEGLAEEHWRQIWPALGKAAALAHWDADLVACEAELARRLEFARARGYTAPRQASTGPRPPAPPRKSRTVFDPEGTRP